jgi:hypothetical protein
MFLQRLYAITSATAAYSVNAQLIHCGSAVFPYIIVIVVDRIRNDLQEELNILTLKDKIKGNKVRWCQDLNRMSEDRLPVKANKYRPTGTLTWEDQGNYGCRYRLRREEENKKIVIVEVV